MRAKVSVEGKHGCGGILGAARCAAVMLPWRKTLPKKRAASTVDAVGDGFERRALGSDRGYVAC